MHTDDKDRQEKKRYPTMGARKDRICITLTKHEKLRMDFHCTVRKDSKSIPEAKPGIINYTRQPPAVALSVQNCDLILDRHQVEPTRNAQY